MQSSYQTSQHPWQIGPTASRVLRWIFGFGFFSVHLGIYLIGGLTLLMINLYRSPDDLWVGGPLVRWGVVVLIHLLGAIVTWAVTTVMDVAKVTRREANARPLYQPPVAVSPEPAASLANEPMPVPRPRFQPTISTPIETVDADDSRRFGFRGWKADQTPPRARTSPPGWTVVRSGDPLPQATSLLSPPVETPAASAPETAPLAGDIGAESPADNRWTWVEAAAEAWLTNRIEKPESSPSETDAVTQEPETTPADETLITIASDDPAKPE